MVSELDFINRATTLYKDLYIYDTTGSVSMRERISIECKVHGYFTRRADEFLSGKGCPICRKENKTEVRGCKYCNRTFKSAHYSKQFCTDECKILFFSKLRTLPRSDAELIDCLWCGKTFMPRREGRPQKYCSYECRFQGTNALNNEWSPILMKYEDICEHKKELILGSLLGDESIVTHSTKKEIPLKCTFSITHGHKQLDYLQWKARMLFPLIHNDVTTVCTRRNSNHTFHVKTSITHPYFDYLRKIFYPNGVKIIPKWVIETLTPLSLAIWYMDDGSFNRNPSSRQAVLCTDGFPIEDVEHAAQALKQKFSLNTRVYMCGSAQNIGGKKYPRIYILRRSIDTLFSIIKPYIHPLLEYKTST